MGKWGVRSGFPVPCSLLPVPFSLLKPRTKVPVGWAVHQTDSPSLPIP
ncbi:hypothetical protein [Moorena producens]